MKKVIVSVVVLVVVLVFVSLIFDWGRREAVAPGGSATTTESQIIVSLPKNNQEVNSPIKISGEARGNWFFEGSFPIKLEDVNGNVLGTSIATSTEDWMTTDFIPFTSELSFEKPTSTTRAILILKNDNPSGNPDFDKDILISVILK
jgi:hypothetical protein